MKSVVLCGYYGMCDSDGQSVGHTGKVTKEYFELLSQNMEISIMASPSIVKTLNEDMKAKSECLRYDIVIDVPFTIKKRILDKFKILHNIHTCFKKTKNETLFFYQVDFFFFFYLLFFHHSKKRNIYCLLYHQDFTGGKAEGILQWIYRKALRKLTGVIYTQKGVRIPSDKALWIPDYFYDEKIYGKYRNMDKQEKVVCLGTMNRYKKLEELVGVFGKISYPLEICGRFDDEERFQMLLSQKSDNVQIANVVLSEEEYYTKLGQAKYSILPYDMGQYTNRTSGVLLESLYVGSMPIAPKQLLEQNELPGYGYGEMEELCEMEWKGPECRNEIIGETILNNSIERMGMELQKFFC